MIILSDLCNAINIALGKISCHRHFKEVIIINKLMKLGKVFTVKRRIIIYKIQVRFIRSE